MWLSSILLFVVAPIAWGDDTTHKYEEGDPVVLWANKVGPFNNPLETYEYFAQGKSILLWRKNGTQVLF